MAIAGFAAGPHEHPADLAAGLRGRSVADIVAAVAALPDEAAVELLDLEEFHAAAAVLQGLPPDRAAVLLEGMSADQAADALRRIPAAARLRLLGTLTPEARGGIDTVLAYPETSAGGLMTTEFVAVPASWTAGETLQHIRTVERSRETIYAIYLHDDATGRLRAAVSLRRLVCAEPGQSVLDLVERTPISVPPETDREEVGRLISQYDLLAVPVVDADGRVMGIVTVDDVMTALIEEQSEDLQRLGGMEALDEPYWESSLFDLVRKRAGWLSFLFVSGMLTATAMQYFEDEIEKAVVLAIFVPLVMSSGGNSGSQATSLMIRSLALEEVRLADWFRVLRRELPSGLALGGILCVLGFLRIAVWHLGGLQDYGEHWLLLALTIGIALLGIVTVGSVVGSMLPFVLKRAGFDPATASAPLIATLVDVTGIVIYFGVAYAILSGTLL